MSASLLLSVGSRRLSLSRARISGAPWGNVSLSTLSRKRSHILHSTRFFEARALSVPSSSSCTASKKYSTAPPIKYEISELTMNEYHRISDDSMEHILSSLEELMEEHSTSENGYEVEYNSGVLTLILGTHGTYVLNKQPPNKQIWLSSPKSGPKRYDYDKPHDTWFYARDGVSLGTLLREELSEIFSQIPDIPLK